MNLEDIIEKHCDNPTKATVEGECPGCHRETTLVLTSSMTMYPKTTENPNPNGPFYACEECSEEYYERMKEQWADYYGGLL